MNGNGRYFNSYDGSVVEGRLWNNIKIDQQTETLNQLSQGSIRDNSDVLLQKLKRRGCGVGIHKTIGDSSTVYEGEIDCGVPHGKGKIRLDLNLKA